MLRSRPSRKADRKPLAVLVNAAALAPLHEAQLRHHRPPRTTCVYQRAITKMLKAYGFFVQKGLRKWWRSLGDSVRSVSAKLFRGLWISQIR